MSWFNLSEETFNDLQDIDLVLGVIVKFALSAFLFVMVILGLVRLCEKPKEKEKYYKYRIYNYQQSSYYKTKSKCQNNS